MGLAKEVDKGGFLVVPSWRNQMDIQLLRVVGKGTQIAGGWTGFCRTPDSKTKFSSNLLWHLGLPSCHMHTPFSIKHRFCTFKGYSTHAWMTGGGKKFK